MGGSKTVWAVAGALAVAAIGAGGLLYANMAAPGKAAEAEAGKSELARFAVGPLTRLETPEILTIAPDYVFQGPAGEDLTFADFRGRVTVVNLWAMWCAPCRVEMPTLARLAAAYPEGELAVLAINVDTGADAIAEARSFLGVNEPLAFHGDAGFKLPFLFPGKGKMPQTILLDRRGRVRAALSGEADWAGPQARALVDALLAETE